MKHPSSKGLWVRASLIVIGKPLRFIVLDAPLMIDIFILTSCFFWRTSCMLKNPRGKSPFWLSIVLYIGPSSIDRSGPRPDGDSSVGHSPTCFRWWRSFHESIDEFQRGFSTGNHQWWCLAEKTFLWGKGTVVLVQKSQTTTVWMVVWKPLINGINYFSGNQPSFKSPRVLVNILNAGKNAYALGYLNWWVYLPDFWLPSTRWVGMQGTKKQAAAGSPREGLSFMEIWMEFITGPVSLVSLMFSVVWQCWWLFRCFIYFCCVELLQTDTWSKAKSFATGKIQWCLNFHWKAAKSRAANWRMVQIGL